MITSSRDRWESYWRAQPARGQEAVFDSEARPAVAEHLPLFQHYFDAALPVVDLACGTGTQTRYLATLYARVIGVDFAEAALELARQLNAAPNVEYRLLDLRDTDAAEALHGELGDVNAYMRGLFHQMDEVDRVRAVDSVAWLLGAGGHLFDVELAPEATSIIRELAGRPEGLPPKLAQIFKHGITPASWRDGELEQLLRTGGLEQLDSGQVTFHTTEFLEDGVRLELPMIYSVARRIAG